ncbi:MAG: MBL fold metallo-hydrolase, partial [Planctomycetota bacterium]
MTLTFGGLDVLCLPIRHTAQSLGYRFTAPITQASIAFSGDADECDALVELARDVDLFVCDAAFPDGQRTEGHLTPSLAAAHAERAGAQRLLLTHFYPECETVDVVGAAAHHCRRTGQGGRPVACDRRPQRSLVGGCHGVRRAGV